MFELLTPHLALFSSIPGFDVIEIIKWGGVIGVALIVFAESGLLIGFLFPGDTLLFTAGFLAQGQYLPVNINLLVGILFVAAVAGDSVGYTFGRRVGRKLFDRPNAKVFKKEYVEKAEKFYEKYGGKTIVIARFTPIVRTLAPILAGTAKMNYKTFLAYNVVGAILWAAGITYAGYFLGTWLTSLGIGIDTILLPAVVVILVISMIPPIVHLARDKKQRDALWTATKLQFSKLKKG
jgi:membrane-associated protein